MGPKARRNICVSSFHGRLGHATGFDPRIKISRNDRNFVVALVHRGDYRLQFFLLSPSRVGVQMSRSGFDLLSGSIMDSLDTGRMITLSGDGQVAEPNLCKSLLLSEDSVAV